MQQMREIRKLIDQRKYEDALTMCDEILQQDPQDRADVLRQRADICRFLEKYAEGVMSCEEIFELGEGRAGDYFCAANLSLYDEQFEEAIVFSERSIEIETENQREWFMSTSLAYLLYALIKTGDLERAEDIYSQLAFYDRDAEDGIYIPNLGWIRLSQFREKIDRDRARLARTNKVIRFE